MTIPDTFRVRDADLYAEELQNEYTQCVDEGLDICAFKTLFHSAAALPAGQVKTQIADALFTAVSYAPQVQDYAYYEPNDLDAIRAEREPFPLNNPIIPDVHTLSQKIRGAWYGRICGCLLGKPLEGIRSEELIPLLRQTGNYPMYRYPLRSEITDEICAAYKFDLRNKQFADQLDCAPADDDTNYTVLAQRLIARYGFNFTSADVLEMWLHAQPACAYFTAEQVAYRNRVAGLLPPYTATVKNPFREWIGAQIRGDYFGYICAGDPETAAALAWRDARISHVKNGIYGEMFISAMIAAAAVTDDLCEIIRCGLGQIPAKSRLHARIFEVLDGYANGVDAQACFDRIHSLYDEHTGYGWCHTISNAMIVAASLLYGEGDFGRSICLAVQAAFDTDCNGATVGSVLGMRGGMDCIDPYWIEPLHGKLHTQIQDVGTVEIESLVQNTVQHIREQSL
ncbi:MAG: ADP-ribosylglycohydrolase family protein [Clostridia bacterium]|nr:ADP-ribosylglycohydrolase family protein [Clostridia bacterium]